jgi:hypothetical protein
MSDQQERCPDSICSACGTWTEREWQAIQQMADKLDISPAKVIQQAVRVYQLIQTGTHELRELNPMSKLAAPSPSESAKEKTKEVMPNESTIRRRRSDVPGAAHPDKHAANEQTPTMSAEQFWPIFWTKENIELPQRWSVSELAALKEFERTMQDEVIPEIERVMRMRARLAQKSRHWVLF